MSYYIFIENGKLNGCGMAQIISDSGIECREVSKEIYEDYASDIRKYILKDNEIILNPDYEKQVEADVQDAINHLTMTSLDIISIVSSLGVPDEDIMKFLNDNPRLDMMLKYCKDVFCGVVREQCPFTVGNVTITDDMVVKVFLDKNETTVEDLKNVKY